MTTRDMYLHFVWAAVFLIGGGYMLLRPDCFTRIRGPFGRRLQVDDAQMQARFDAAVARREQAERLPRALGLYIGGITIAVGIIAAVSRIQPAVLYGVLCLIMSSITGITYMQLRNMQAKRVAVLAPRSATSVIPAYWYALSIVNALSILTFATHPELRIPAILVCLSSLATMALASRLAHLPALLSGDDVPAEQLVDDRVRTLRTCNVLSLAVVQPFVFCSQLLKYANDVQTATMFFTLAIFLAYMAWAARKRTAQPPLLTAR